MSDQIARDVRDHIVEKQKAFLERELQLAYAVLSPVDIAMIMVTLACGTVGTAAATIAGMGNDESNPGEVFDTVVDQVFKTIRSNREDSLKQVAAARAHARAA